jgi:hypothetical protein
MGLTGLYASENAVGDGQTLARRGRGGQAADSGLADAASVFAQPAHVRGARLRPAQPPHTPPPCVALAQQRLKRRVKHLPGVHQQHRPPVRYGSLDLGASGGRG